MTAGTAGDVTTTLTAIQWFTDFGDQAVVLPMAAGVSLLLLAARRWRGVLAWIAAVGGVLATMLVLKLGIGACGWTLGIPGLDSPSGHTASATVLYGGLAVLLFPRLRPATRAVLVPAIACCFAASRVALHDHSVLEVLIGGAVGLCGVSVLRRLAGPIPEPIRPTWLGVVFACVFLLAHGHRLKAEQRVHSFAVLRLRALLCPEPSPSGTGTLVKVPPLPHPGETPSDG